MAHKQIGVQRYMLEKLGLCFVQSVQAPLEAAKRYGPYTMA